MKGGGKWGLGTPLSTPSKNIVFLYLKINSADPDDIPHNAAFHLGLHCFQKYTGFRGFKSKKVIRRQMTKIQTADYDHNSYMMTIFYRAKANISFVCLFGFILTYPPVNNKHAYM